MQLTKQENQILKTLVAKLKSDFHAEKVILFGSAARGQLQEYSDIDILAVLPELDWNLEKKIISLCYQAQLECDRVVSTTCYSSREFFDSPLSESPLVLNALKEGVSL